MKRIFKIGDIVKIYRYDDRQFISFNNTGVMLWKITTIDDRIHLTPYNTTNRSTGEIISTFDLNGYSPKTHITCEVQLVVVGSLEDKIKSNL